MVASIILCHHGDIPISPDLVLVLLQSGPIGGDPLCGGSLPLFVHISNLCLIMSTREIITSNCINVNKPNDGDFYLSVLSDTNIGSKKSGVLSPLSAF